MNTVKDITTKICPECSREFSVLHPDRWAYKKQNGKRCTYWCSWKCMRRTERDEDEVQMKKDGTPAKKPGRKPQKIETPEQVATVKVSGPIVIQAEDVGAVEVETPEGEFTDFGKVTREERYTVTAIRYPEIGEFYFDKKFNALDWRTAEGEEVSMSPIGWKILLKDLTEVLDVLGVEL